MPNPKDCTMLSQLNESLKLALTLEKGTFAFVHNLAKKFTESIKARNLVSKDDYLAVTKLTKDMDGDVILRHKISETKLCLQRLDLCRYKLHEELEIQSMRRSKYQLIYDELVINKDREIADAVAGVISQNSERLKKLKETIKKYDDILEADGEHMKFVEEKNRSVLQKRNTIVTSLEEKNLEWNKLTSLKYELQIKLQERRDEIKIQSNEIALDQETFLEMKEELIKEHSASIEIVEELKPKIKNIKDVYVEWNGKNLVLNRELKHLNIGLTNLNMQIDNIKQNADTLQTRITTQSESISDRTNYLECQKKVQAKFLKDRKYITSEMQKVEKKYETHFKEKKKALMNVQLQIDQAICKNTERKRNLLTKNKIKSTFHIRRGSSDDIMTGKKQEFNELKREMSTLRIDINKLKRFNYELENRMNHGVTENAYRIESHLQTIDACTESYEAIQDYIRLLDEAKRKIKLELELLDEQQDHFIDHIRMEAALLLANYNEKRSKARETQKEALALIEMIKECLKEIKALKRKYKKELKVAAVEIEEKQGDATKTEVDKKQITAQLKKALSHYNIIQVKHHKLENSSRKQSLVYSYMREKEGAVEEELHTAQKSLGNKKRKLSQWNLKIDHNRAAYLKILGSNAIDIGNIEEDIYSTVNKIRGIIRTNSDFRMYIEKSEYVSETWKKRIEEKKREREILLLEYEDLKKVLEEMRKMMDVMVESTQERELKTENALGDVAEIVCNSNATADYIEEKIEFWLNKFRESFGKIEELKNIN